MLAMNIKFLVIPIALLALAALVIGAVVLVVVLLARKKKSTSEKPAQDSQVM